MTRVAEALSWSGVDIAIGMYCVYMSCNQEGGEGEKRRLLSESSAKFRLEDECGILKGREVVHYEIKLQQFPDSLAGYLNRCIEWAFADGASFVWFAFEGSFDFEHILTEDVANQIYCICGEDGNTAMALEDDVLLSTEWAAVVAKKRELLLAM
ncbi:hypothetical protein [Lysobacter sp. CA196]|uniref:hypothetical protein n=1 Tax=Lysobacter sp. CA196 TaxID=3455606 RepID=UPI003F8D206B